MTKTKSMMFGTTNAKVHILKRGKSFIVSRGFIAKGTKEIQETKNKSFRSHAKAVAFGKKWIKTRKGRR